VPLFLSVALDAAPAFRELLAQVVGALLPDPLVRAGGPVHLETSLVETPSSTVLHLLSFVASRAAELPGVRQGHPGLDIVQDPFPVVDAELEIRVDRPVTAVHLQPEGTSLPFTVENGYVRTRATVLDGHQMVVVDHQ